MPKAGQNSEDDRWHATWGAARHLVEQDHDMTHREKRLVLQYVHTALEAVRANPPLLKSMRAGAMGPHAMATTLTLLIMLSTGEPLD